MLHLYLYLSCNAGQALTHVITRPMHFNYQTVFNVFVTCYDEKAMYATKSIKFAAQQYKFEKFHILLKI